MTAKNALSTTPPYPVDQALKQLGAQLRSARRLRNLTIKQVAKKIGTGPRPIADAEKGKPTTGAVVYVALLWVYDLLGSMNVVVDSKGLEHTTDQDRARASAPR